MTAGFDILTAVVMNSSIFWDITVLIVNQHFGGTCHLIFRVEE